MYNLEILAAEGNAKEKLRIEKAFQEAKLMLMKKYNIDGINDTKNAMARAVSDSVEWLESDGGQAITGTMDVLVSGMSSVFSQLSSLIQAEFEIQTAAIENRYKKEANKKMFAMQVIQAVAQTAQGAISAYSSAAAIPEP